MAIDFVQTDTAAPLGVIQACVPIAPAGDADAKQASVGGTPGVTELACTVPASSSSYCYADELNIADSDSLDAGTLTARINITTAQMDVTLEEIYVCRVNSSGVSQETLGSVTGLATDVSGGGVFAQNVTLSAASAHNAGDKVVIGYVFANAFSMSSRNVANTPDQTINTPFTAAAEEVTLDKWNFQQPEPIRRRLRTLGDGVLTENTVEAEDVTLDKWVSQSPVPVRDRLRPIGDGVLTENIVTSEDVTLDKWQPYFPGPLRKIAYSFGEFVSFVYAGFDLIRQDIIAGLDSDQAEATGWDAIVKTSIPLSAVVRTSDTVVTITLPAFASYDITANETITATVPASSLETSTDPVVATPTFDIAAITLTESEIMAALNVPFQRQMRRPIEILSY